MSVSDTGRGIYDARQYRCEERWIRWTDGRRRAVGYVFPAALISMLFILRIVSARTGLPERLNGVRAVPENDIFDDEDV